MGREKEENQAVASHDTRRDKLSTSFSFDFDVIKVTCELKQAIRWSSRFYPRSQFEPVSTFPAAALLLLFLLLLLLHVSVVETTPKPFF